MSKTKSKSSRRGSSSDSPVRQVNRRIPEPVRSRLIASSAGRCEFRGCNKDLYQHHVTGTTGNFAEAAHIVAFKVRGPRGEDEAVDDINSFENLMLLCPACHKLIDSEPRSYPVDQLREHKREHEQRIFALTALGPEQRTTVIQVRATIGTQSVDIPGTDIQSALHPRYAASLPGVFIDLTQIRREGPLFFSLARDEIRRELRPALRAALDQKCVQHLSVLALAPIPILICLGRELGNKINVDLFQKHRDSSQGWRWYDDGAVVDFEFAKLRDGTNPKLVGLLLSLSGRVDVATLPATVAETATLYEIRPRGRGPSVELIRRRDDLNAFRQKYREALACIVEAHGGLTAIDLFPAVPAPVAIACGQEVMPKAHPALKVFDNVKVGFVEAITVNTMEDL